MKEEKMSFWIVIIVGVVAAVALVFLALNSSSQDAVGMAGGNYYLFSTSGSTCMQAEAAADAKANTYYRYYKADVVSYCSYCNDAAAGPKTVSCYGNTRNR